mmetsp:Transcript_26066/g.34213  ORF Transcript_26066/g.34213 Transcript_26066/m.34213 type:complete len:168 (+) Transcript_26066:63-566(+)
MSKKDADDDYDDVKGSGGRGGKATEDKEDSILQKAIAYCWSDEFLDIFRNYFKLHASKFKSHAEGTTEEHDLEWQDLYQEYLGIYEDTLSEYITSQGFSVAEFYDEIKDAKETSSDPKIQLFVDCLLASCDYASFYKVMVQMAKKEMFKAEAKDDGESKESYSSSKK